MIINENKNLNNLLTSYKALQQNKMLIINLGELFSKNNKYISCLKCYNTEVKSCLLY